MARFARLPIKNNLQKECCTTRGGSALIVNPGDTLYLLFDKFDDYFAYTLAHVNRDGKQSVYFDRIDPRFRERYDAMHALATTPTGMKDFLVEFSSNDPDKRVLPVFSKLLGEMRAQNNFEGFHVAYQLIGDAKDYDAMRRTATTLEHKAVIQAIEDEKQAEIRRREEVKLAEARRQEARLAAELQAEQARAAEQRCLSTPSCRQAIEDKRAACVQSVQSCRAGCDRLVGAGSFGSWASNLVAAGMARVCSAGCKCDNSFGDVIAKFNQATSGEAVQAASASRPSTSSKSSITSGGGSTQSGGSGKVEYVSDFWSLKNEMKSITIRCPNGAERSYSFHVKTSRYCTPTMTCNTSEAWIHRALC